MDWDDLRIFGAVVLQGGLAAGAKAAGVSEGAARRRLRALEHRCGFSLVRRTVGGLAPTPAGERLAGPVKAMVARTVARSSRQNDADAMVGVVRIEVDPRLDIGLLMPLLARWRDIYPKLAVDLMSCGLPAAAPDPTADIVIRMGSMAKAPANGRIVARLPRGWFAHRRYLEGVGAPATPADLDRLDLIGCACDALNQRVLSTCGSRLKASDIAFKTDSLLGRQGAIRAGVGMGPAFVDIMRDDPDVIRVLPHLQSELPLWTALVDGAGAGERPRRLREAIDRHFEGLGAEPGEPRQAAPSGKGH
jgi:DNA-binding transcriptional LysR family regulator